MADFKIEKNIDLPPPKTNATKYPFRGMAVGDSIFVSSEDGSHGRAGNAAYNWGRRESPQVKFATRRVDGGIRIWRIK